MITNPEEFFDQADDEFLKFERVENPLSSRPDLHAFLLLDQLVSGTTDIVSDAEHDEIYLSVDCDQLFETATPEQVIDLVRCGVRYCSEYNSLCMFV